MLQGSASKKALPLAVAAIGDHRRSDIILGDKLASVSDAIDAALPYLFGVSPARAALQARGALVRRMAFERNSGNLAVMTPIGKEGRFETLTSWEYV